MAQDWPSSQSDTRLKVTEKGVFVGQHQVLSILFEQLGKVGIVCVKSFSSPFLHLAVQCNLHWSRKPVLQTRSLMAFLQLGLPVICKVLL